MIELKVNYILTIFFILNSIYLTKVSATELERFFPKSCKDGLNQIKSFFQIQPEIVQVQVRMDKKSFYVRCNHAVDHGGWTVILHRYNGQQDFNCNWHDCVKGFGNINGEFFIGLEKLHDITSYMLHELAFILEDFGNNMRIAQYDAFAIEDGHNAYLLYLLGNYSGNAGNSFEYHAGRKFSAKNKDNTQDCVRRKGAPGWFYDCSKSNIFGEYLNGTHEDTNSTKLRGMYWTTLQDPYHALKRITMMIRPKF